MKVSDGFKIALGQFFFGLFFWSVAVALLILLGGCTANQPGADEFYSFCTTKDAYVYAPVNGTCPYQFGDEIP